jgi:hypothetical protein
MSIGRALDVPAGVLYDEVREVIAAIDRVHGVRALPRIPIRLVRGMIRFGRFNYDRQEGRPISIVVRLNQPFRRLTILHEIGHFLDLCAFGDGVDFGTLINPTLGAWNATITSSRSYREATELLRQGVALVETEDGRHVEVTLTADELDSLRPLVQPEELWARSYAQYVVTHADHRLLDAELHAIRLRQRGEVYYPIQWDDDDFVTIGNMFDELLISLGWRQ